MESKFNKFIKKNLKYLIFALILWTFAEVILVAPISFSISNSYIEGKFDIAKFLMEFFSDIMSFNKITQVFNKDVIGIFGKATAIFTFLLSLAFAVGAYKARDKTEYQDIEHGSSDWSVGGEQYRVLSRNSGLILAENHHLPLNKLGNINVLIVGGSGSGKSSSYTIPNAHQLLGSYIFTDPKGEIYDATAGYMKQNGYQIKLLNLVNPKSSDSYNPIEHIRSEIDVDIIASTIVKGQKTESSASDPFWDNMAELLLKSLIYYILAKRPPEEQNLASCAELVRAANNNGGSNLLTELMRELPYDHPARMNYKSVEISSEKTYSSILSTLQSKLGKFDSKDIADVTSTNTINFDEIATKKTALYVVSSDTHTAYDFLLTIFFSQMIQQLYDYADKNGGKLPQKTFFILDEFANIGQIPDFDKKISTSRSRGISFSVILQNLDQLKGIYEKSYETIIGNCDTHVFLGSNSYATVEYFSKELGEKTITHNSRSTNRNNADIRTGFSVSDQIMARALMTPDELRRMDNNYCIIFEKGLKPIKAKKFWYYKSHMIKDFENTKIDHNDYQCENRGEWRKFDPNNPYTQSTVESPQKSDIKIESLDDLLISENKEDVKEKESQIKTTGNNENTVKEQDMTILPGFEDEIKQKPTVPQEDEIDIQKELEAKFDELFGTSNN